MLDVMVSCKITADYMPTKLCLRLKELIGSGDTRLEQPQPHWGQAAAQRARGIQVSVGLGWDGPQSLSDPALRGRK